jgi:alcohol dehydrogenase
MRDTAVRRTIEAFDRKEASMKALVYHGPGARSWETVPDPGLTAPTDVVMRVDAVTICGTDLHILKGDVPEVQPGTILGHEAVGTVVDTGAAVTTLEEGDRVLASCITSCGRCPACRDGRYGLCTGGGGWILGHLIDGVQAEYARIPFADTSAYRIPAGLTDEQVLFLADILPTSFEVGVLAGRLRPGDTVAIVGAGPIGLAAVLTASLFTPSRVIVVDPDQSRVDRALGCGASHAVTETGEAARDRVLALTDGIGVDLAIEAVGVPETFELCTDIVRAGGHVANVGVHGKPATLHLERLWIKDVTITTGLVDTNTTPRLMQLIEAGKLDPAVFATHRFSLDEAMEAYDAFADATTSGAFKVVLEGEKHRQLVPVGAAAGDTPDDRD